MNLCPLTGMAVYHYWMGFMLPENFPIYYIKFGSLVVTSEHAADVMQESKCMILHLIS